MPVYDFSTIIFHTHHNWFQLTHIENHLVLFFLCVHMKLLVCFVYKILYKFPHTKILCGFPQYCGATLENYQTSSTFCLSWVYTPTFFFVCEMLQQKFKSIGYNMISVSKNIFKRVSHSWDIKCYINSYFICIRFSISFHLVFYVEKYLTYVWVYMWKKL